METVNTNGFSFISLKFAYIVEIPGSPVRDLNTYL